MLNGKQIREVTAQGIKYVDENNVEQFIDFAVCNQNYLDERQSPERWESYKKWNNKTDADWDEYIKRRKGDEVIGKRDALAKKPYIEFYTIPPLTFEFDTKDEFDKVAYVIMKARYRTLDMT